MEDGRLVSPPTNGSPTALRFKLFGTVQLGPGQAQSTPCVFLDLVPMFYHIRINIPSDRNGSCGYHEPARPTTIGIS